MKNSSMLKAKNSKLEKSGQVTKSNKSFSFQRSAFGGFTIIEMLIVLLVFGVLTIIVTQSLAQSLKGTRKSANIVSVRGNVDTAMATMERLLHNAQGISFCDLDTLNYVDEFGNNANFSCVVDEAACGVGNNDGYIASGSAALKITSSGICVDCDNATNVFSCYPGTSNVPPYVVIGVTAKDADYGATEEGAQVTLKTRVLLRNY